MWFFFCFSPSVFGADDICEEYPHNFHQAPGYWIECSRQKITSETGCVEESGSDERELNGSNSDGADGPQDYCGIRYGRPRGSDSLLLEDDEYYPYDDDYVMPPSRYSPTINCCLRARAQSFEYRHRFLQKFCFAVILQAENLDRGTMGEKPVFRTHVRGTGNVREVFLSERTLELLHQRRGSGSDHIESETRNH